MKPIVRFLLHNFKNRDLGLLLIRLGIGFSMLLFHGWGKITAGPERWAGIGANMANLGLDFAPAFWGFMAAFAESVGSALLILGFAFRPAAMMLAFTMLVAIVRHLGVPEGEPGAGWDGASHALELFAVYLGLLLTGPGKYRIGPRDTVRRGAMVLVVLLPLTACAAGADDPDVDASPGTNVVVEGELDAFGDASIRYTATLDPQEQLLRIEQTVLVGDYGSYVEAFVLANEQLVESIKTGEQRVLTGDRTGEMDKVRRVLRFAPDGTLVESEKTVNGADASVEPFEHEGTLLQLDELRRYVAAQRTAEAFAERRKLAGQWRANAATGGTYTMDLFLDHGATGRVDLRGNPPLLLRGIWRGASDDRVDVVFTRIENDPIEPERWRLHAQGTDRLENVEGGWTFARIGGAIPDELLATTWEWTGFVNPVEEIQVEDPSLYTLRFEPDGTIALRADCNRITGSVTLGEGRRVVFSPMASTMAACPEGSLADRYLDELGRAVHYFLRDGKLHFDLPIDTGTLAFRPTS